MRLSSRPEVRTRLKRRFGWQSSQETKSLLLVFMEMQRSYRECGEIDKGNLRVGRPVSPSLRNMGLFIWRHVVGPI
jgi:hypothetical protein